MKIEDWYKQNWDSRLTGRYITLEKIMEPLNGYESIFQISNSGISERGKKIPLVTIGHGKNKILAWSQMHGNESTTTKALFDLFKFLAQKNHFQKEINQFLQTHTLYVLPLLNPDGAEAYTRQNANNIDLNRDAQALSQSESRVLRDLYDSLSPDLCLNMHDQRTLYGLDNGNPAIISFLSPAANKELTITPARKQAMEGIVKMNQFLQNRISGKVGRYDDSFNDACVGDTFQMNGTSTILFEAGHFPGDYQREKTRELIFYSLLVLFGIHKTDSNNSINFEDYFQIPENRNSFRDIIIRNALLEDKGEPVDIAIQYLEVLKEGDIVFEPYIDEVGTLTNLTGHLEINVDFSKISSKPKKTLIKGAIIHKLVNKSQENIVFFDGNVL